MELMVSKEESDGKRKKLCTVHTQTDFGPYSAFPPQGGNDGPSAPSSPAEVRSSPSDANITYLQEATHLERTTDTVDGRSSENTGMKEMNGMNGINVTNGITSNRISLHSEEFTLLRSSVLGKSLWDRGNTSYHNENH
jgi:hypothetical protein